jgi:hypothetical protein
VARAQPQVRVTRRGAGALGDLPVASARTVRARLRSYRDPRDKRGTDQMTSARTPAGTLVSAFGRPDAMSVLYSPDIQWSLSASLTQFPRPIDGKDAVVAFNQRIWSDVYRPDCQTEILDEVGDDASSAVRFIYRAHLVQSGIAYENEYTLFARSGPDGIFAVFEGLDTAASSTQSSPPSQCTAVSSPTCSTR